MNAFRFAKSSLGDIDAEAAASLIAVAADISLVIDDAGVIRDLAIGNPELAAELDAAKNWIDRPFADTVTQESRPKVDLLLAVQPGQPTQWRHLNHNGRSGGSIAVLYSTVAIPGSNRMVAFGRDLSPISILQQRLVNAQQSMERDYARLRNMEARYRLLFDISTDAVLLLDANSHKVIEANRAAQELLERAERRLVGRNFSDIVDTAADGDGNAMLASIRSNGRSEEVRANIASTSREVMISASMFRQDDQQLILVRMAPVSAGGTPESEAQLQLLRAIEIAPDGFVVSDVEGRLLSANGAFLEMASIASEEQARGHSLDEWIGRPGVDFDVLVSTLRQRGTVRLFNTILRGVGGAVTEVEISAVAVSSSGTQCFGFAIRNIARRLPTETRGEKLLPRSVEQLTELIGRVPLKEVVREATDVIERLCIEAALELTGDNRASAAEMLQLSRQSLYVKLRRYGLGDLSDPSDS